MLPTKIWFIWTSVFGEDLKKSANQKQELPVWPMFVNRSGQNEQCLERTFHRCFLPSFSSFGWKVSEEKIKMRKVNGIGWKVSEEKIKRRKVNGRWTPSDGKSSLCLWQGELKMGKGFTIWHMGWPFCKYWLDACDVKSKHITKDDFIL